MIGCTGVVAYINRDKLYVANVGDSRAVLSHNGTALCLYFPSPTATSS